MPIIDTAAPDAVVPPPSAGPTAGPKAGASSRTTGVRERRDKTPKTRATRAPGRPSKDSETEAIGRALGQLLAAPGAIFGMINEPFLGDQVATDDAGRPLQDADGKYVSIPGHFSRTGPSFGMQLAKASETNPALRRILKNAMAGDSIALLLMGGIAYAAPPLVYLLTPNHSPIRKTLGVPPRPRREPDAGPDFDLGPHADTEEDPGAE